MPQGLQVFNASGQVVCDITDRITRIIAIVTISGSGSINVPEWATSSGFFAVLPLADITSRPNIPVPSITGTVLSWTTSGSSPVSVSLIYGAF